MLFRSDVQVTGTSASHALDMRRTNSGVVSSGDTIGSVRFLGNDGSAYRVAASIYGAVDATPGASDMPGRLVFSTTADGAASPTERMRLDSSGNLGVGVTPSGTYKLEVNGNTSVTGNIVQNAASGLLQNISNEIGRAHV